jgi:uncharacterized membrane protein
MNPDVYFPDQKETYQAHPLSLLCHVGGGVVALFLGPFQFIEGIRKKNLRLHKILGRFYGLGVVVGAMGGLAMATRAFGGFPAGLGFGMLAVLWLVTIVMAVTRARQHRIVQHREWVIRSFALTLAALTLRIYLPVHGVLLGTEVIDLPFIQMYRAVGWLCWVPNLIVAEWFINSTRKQPVPAS